MKTSDIASVGFSEADITPDQAVQLVGFFRPDNRSRGILHPLKLQTLVWNKGLCTGCLVTIDSLGFTVELSNTLRDRISVALHTQREYIMLCFSHTHGAPDGAAEPEYFDFVCRQAVFSALNAAEAMEPVSASWGIGENRIGENRRDEQDCVDNRLGILKLSHPALPTRPDLPTHPALPTRPDLPTHPALPTRLDFSTRPALPAHPASSTRPDVIVLRVTAHANILSGDNYLISSDYFGVARARLEAQYGCKVMMIQGAAGDIRPRYRQDNEEYVEIHCYEMAAEGFSEEYRKKYTAQSRKALELTAEDICDAVGSVMGSLKPGQIEHMGIKSVFRRFAADVPSMERAKEIAEEAEKAGIDGKAWLLEVERLHREGIKHQYGDVEIQYFSVNEGCLCGIANEAMCRIALDVSEAAHNPLLFFNGYTNGCNSYLPTAEEYDKGGYEVLWSNLVYFPYHGRVMPLNRDTAEQLVQEVVRNRPFYDGGELPQQTHL